MALSDLIAHLERDAQTRSDEVARRGREQIEQIEAEAGRASAQRRDEELAVRHARRQAQLDRELAAARAKARGEALRARQLLIEQIFTRARAQLPSRATDPRVRALIAARVARARGYLAEGQLGVEVTPEAASGVVLQAADGSMTIDLTLERALETARPELAIALAKELP